MQVWMVYGSLEKAAEGYDDRTATYLKSDVDTELIRLRERVAELESANAHCHEGMQKLSEKVIGLLECVRWCLENGAAFDTDYDKESRKDIRNGKIRDAGCGCCSAELDIPAHLAPLIAEAVKQEGPNGECPICGGAPCKPGCEDGSVVL